MSVSSGRYTLAVLSGGGTVRGAWDLLGGSRGDVLALPQLFGSDRQSADRVGQCTVHVSQQRALHVGRTVGGRDGAGCNESGNGRTKTML